ncbi:MAG TPA: hypothetical protein VF576_13770, partial [Rubricoccaceae bacterium]
MSFWSAVSRPVAVLAAGAAVLVLLLAATAGVEAWRAGRVDALDGRRAQAEAVQDVQDALAGVFGEMEARARRVADSPAVRPALVRPDSSLNGPHAARALAALDALGLPPSTSVEVVSPSGALVAWTGSSFPRPPGPPPDSVVSQTDRDDAGRRALALWWPVRGDGGRLLGAVRVVRLAQAAVPVRNRYLQDYDIADE